MIQLIDIEKELRSIKTEYKPDERLRQRTRSLVAGEIGKKRRGKVSFRRAAFLYSPAAAVVLVIALCVSLFTAAPAKAAGYYTIDINPSVSVGVDENNTVISVTPENEDAAVMLEGLDIKGMQFEDAFKTLLQAADVKDFLKEDGHVLVAYFGDGEGITQDEVNAIVNEQLPEKKISALALNGNTDDYDNAKKSGKKAGIELLLDNADAAGIEESDPDTVIDIMSDKLKDGQDKPGKDKGKGNNGNGVGAGNSDNNGPGSANSDNGNNGKDKDNKDKGNNGKDNKDKENRDNSNNKDKNN